jgi:hypothetical protein
MSRIVAIIFAALTWYAPCAHADPDRGASPIVYVDPEHLYRDNVYDKIWKTDPIVAKEADNAWYQGFSEGVSSPVLDCSDESYRCIESWSRTLAIPKTRLGQHARYEKNGVIFEVENCLRLTQATCNVALISGKHSRKRDDSTEADKTATFDYVVYFIFNENNGITAMGVTRQSMTTIPAMREIATQTVLVGERGLLAK